MSCSRRRRRRRRGPRPRPRPRPPSRSLAQSRSARLSTLHSSPQLPPNALVVLACESLNANPRASMGDCTQIAQAATRPRVPPRPYA
eukprot:6209856-Pleurochrysis_carterae.AAC.2